MNVFSIVRIHGPLDLKNVRRDDLLAWIALLPLALALVVRLATVPLTELLRRELGFDLAPYYPLLMSFVAVMAPSMAGMVIGFLLLDERDDQVLTALMVTPTPLAGYLTYRILLPLALGWLITLVVYPLAGLAELKWIDLFAVAGLAACNGPVTALFLAAFAENKLTGFALVKILNSINMVPVLAYFAPGAWQLLAGVVPAFWPMKMLWLAAAGQSYFLYGLAGVVVNAAAILLLLRRFDTVLHR